MRKDKYLEKVKRMQAGGMVDTASAYYDRGAEALGNLYEDAQGGFKDTRRAAANAISPERISPKSPGDLVDNAWEGMSNFAGDVVDVFSQSGDHEAKLLAQQAKESSAQAYQTLKQDFSVLAQHLYEQGDQAAIELLTKTWDKVSAISEAAIAFQQGGKISDNSPAPEPKHYDGAFVGVVGQRPYYFDDAKQPIRAINLGAENFPKTLRPVEEYTNILDGEPSKRS